MNTGQCRLCRTQLPAAARFCPRCGQRAVARRHHSTGLLRLAFILTLVFGGLVSWMSAHRSVPSYYRVAQFEERSDSPRVSTYNPPMLPRTPSHYAYYR